MRTLWIILRSIYAWIGISLLVLIMIPVIGLVRLFDRDPVRYRTGYVFRKMGSWVTKVNPMWKVELKGAEIITNPRNPYIVVSNHQSMADIPCISYVPWEMKWVSKTAVFKVPLAGWLLRFAADIPVNRSDKESRGGVYDKVRKVLRQKCSVMFFAEGTRSKDRLVLPFHDGAFKLAIEEQVPIIPIAIDGSHDCLPKHSWLFRNNSRVRVQVLPPVDTNGMTKQDLPALRHRVRNAIMDQVAEWRGVTRLEVDSQIKTLTWPESTSLAKIFANAAASLTELQQWVVEAMAYHPKWTAETSEYLNQLKERLAVAMKELPHYTGESMEEIYRQAAEVKAAWMRWQHRTEERFTEMPQQLAEAIEEFFASLGRLEPTLQPA